MADRPLHYQTITHVSEMLASRAITSVDLTRHLLDRIEALDGQLKSYATVMTERAIESAERADREIVSGKIRGPLHGVPIAVKDLCFTKGVSTMGGSQVLSDHVPEYDGTVVRKLKAAGAVLLGKLNLTEGAMGGYSPAFDAPLNPWASDRWAGASSSGSGAATSAGLCFGSLGSDTGGSIRFPAAACGTVGLKPTWGRVSRYGILPLAESLDHVGPLTRSVADAGIVLQAIAGQDLNDPTSLSDAVPDMLANLNRGVGGIRLGFDERYVTQDIDPEMAASVVDAIKVLEGLGAELVEVELPNMDPYVDAWKILCSAEAVAAHRKTYPLRRKDYGPWFRDWLDLGASITAAEYAEANTLRLESNGHVRRVLHDIDILVCPSMSAPAHPVTREILYGPLPEDRVARFQRFTAPFDYSGSPTLSIPTGLSNDGIPLSLQLVGKHLSEPLLIRVGHSYEKTTNWPNPPDFS
ncbi:amidase [bacterium]|nr:Asp-tRNA(Asn)/Glu-tRNA(Gln) amidotransferase GatCAB subunit A [Gemmatimonadota bacterium]MCH2664315.1 amidase [bacterium]HCK09070.1 Asp-tRNA(Asn)/Glu-tRNA(Gln) amidotransferase GatCAB subunit A [Candidatus Latescibacterota bacterium]